MIYVIGEAIRNKILEKGMTFVAFADKFGLSDRNLQYVFKKEDLPISQILRASELLEYDFLTDYVKAKKPKYLGKNILSENDEKSSVGKQKKISINLTISGGINSYDNFPKFLKIIKEEANGLGFEIA